MKRLDVLALIWPGTDRDEHMIVPTLLELERRGYTVRFKNMFLSYFYILLYRPKVMLTSSAGGAVINHWACLFAKRIGCRVISLIAEGNVQEIDLDEFLWGHNRERIWFLDKVLLWNKKSYDLFVGKYPELKNYLEVTGAIGFDRYKLLKFHSKQEFLKDRGLFYQKVVGLGGWSFYYISEKCIPNLESLPDYGKEKVLMHRKDLLKLRKIYRELVENNPDTLFLVKYHPAVPNVREEEFTLLEGLPNVLYFGLDRSEKLKISDLISISDFLRSEIYLGSALVNSAQELQSLVTEFYRSGHIAAFNEKAELRQRLTDNVIGFDDGQNYLRTADSIEKTLQESVPEVRIQLYPVLKSIGQIFRFGAKVLLLPFRHGSSKLFYFNRQYRKTYYSVIKGRSS